MKTALNLLDQIIEEAEVIDHNDKIRAVHKGEGEEAVGESWIVFHLKRLRELIENEEKKDL